MGVRNLATVQKPEPKATCASCGRPLAILKTGQCVYCGAKVPGLTVVRNPAEIQLAQAVALLEPRPPENTNRRWLIRIGAIALGGAVLAIVIGTCMRR